MNHFYVIRFHKWKHWTLIVLLAFFTAGFIWFGSTGPFSLFSKDNPVALTKGSSDEPNIALTFNISWGEKKVFDILKQLKQHQVKATFFVSGEWAEKHPNILAKISEDKHEIGMLGYRYKSYLDQELDQIRKDLTYAKDIFGKLGYKNIKLLRAPHGHLNDDVIKLAEELKYNVIHWNINPNDWQNPGTQVVVDQVMSKTTNGDIILLHASDSVKQTAEALETILPGLQNKGFTFVTVSEMLHHAQAKSKIVE
ncbi:polysaccharide deacetylase family sporulation protein PdaB [Ornithinibacillus contaminans]|uniref:polysaccharide deacetylase family sporulation protein PdaB n=1 Tax=Ornithinibacillus contaminans TaxID=694055 RepID=UPI00064D8F0A|nr:polysaccharide deacetylase family sporulation protein PdaB [Ornithinibacillus contaminans]